MTVLIAWPVPFKKIKVKLEEGKILTEVKVRCGDLDEQKKRGK